MTTYDEEQNILEKPIIEYPDSYPSEACEDIAYRDERIAELEAELEAEQERVIELEGELADTLMELSFYKNDKK